MRNLASLKETRASKADAIRAIVAKATTENRDLNDAEQTAFEAGRGEVERLDRDIRNAEFLADIERRAEAEPVRQVGDTMAALERRYRVGKALAEFSDGGRLTGAEAEWAAEHRTGRPGAIAMPTIAFLGERRSLSTTTPVDGPGGNLVATDLGPTIDRLRPLLAIEAMGATVLSGLVANLDLPRLKGSGTAGWVEEDAAAQRSDARFDSVEMSPKTVTAEYQMSRKLMLQAPQLETLLRQDLGYLLAQALDGAAIMGGGVSEPDGIIGMAGVSVISMGANGGALTIDTAADLIGAVADANAGGAASFLTNSKVRRAAMKLKDANGRPYQLSDVFKNEAVTFSNQVPSKLSKGTASNSLSALLYGVWSDLVIGYWSAVDIVLNPYHPDVSSKGGALLNAFLDADVALRHPESFAVAKDIIA